MEEFSNFDGTGFATIETFETSHGGNYPDPNAAGNPAAYFSSNRDVNSHDGRTRRALALLLWTLRGADAASEFSYRGRVYWKRAQSGVASGETSQAWTVNGVRQGSSQSTSTNPGLWTITEVVFADAQGHTAHYRYTGTDGQKLDNDSYQYWTRVAATPPPTPSESGTSHPSQGSTPFDAVALADNQPVSEFTDKGFRQGPNLGIEYSSNYKHKG